MSPNNKRLMRIKESRLSVDRIRELLHYDAETGILTWREQMCAETTAGARAEMKAGHGYLAVRIDGAAYRAHRVAWCWVHGQWPADLIDHRNTIRSDNRLSNLRDADALLNQQNKTKAQRSSSTGIIGIKPNRTGTGFEARIQVKRVRLHLGTFATMEEAHAVYVQAKRVHHAGCTL